MIQVNTNEHQHFKNTFEIIKYIRNRTFVFPFFKRLLLITLTVKS
jgi:hypothetical protein